ncbi:EamA family transporter [Paenibacillus sp. 598K]|uniref:DMT family transporter n=1 Tax=Paenibacillus sp. 598K TaxID=1117987 RepID=UPI000FFAF5FC|nr:DMT family transporter [Paenibacillus sp. 598K]GBF78015.1 EamA family transporter [Paenibacillus sp. 598K]
MGYVYLLLATLAWSFVGLLVKSASTMVDAPLITFARFSLGILFLGAFLFMKNGRLELRGNLRWIWLGAIGKSINYIFENIAISMGYAYGNILVPPIQTVVLLAASAWLFRERVSGKGWIAAACCIAGVLAISWNGQPLDSLLGASGWITVLFACSAFGSALHVLSQKRLIEQMDNGTMNFSVFFWCSVLTALPLPVQSAGLIGPVSGAALLALAALGLITGLSFVWFAEAVRRVPFPMVILVSNSMALFTILWSFLFLGEPITGYILGGTFLFFLGLVLLHLPLMRAKRRPEAERAEETKETKETATSP